MKHLKTFILLISFPVSSFAATYYVAATGSSNSNNGSEGSPWATIQYAVDQVSAGDSIVVENGSYDPFHVTTHGTNANRIVVQARNRQAVTINGSESYGGRYAGIHITSDYVTIDGFRVIATGSPSSERGIRLSGTDGDIREGVTISNNYVSNAGWTGITTSFANNVVVEYNEVTGSVGQHGIYVANSGDNPIIRGNYIHNNNQAGLHMNGDQYSGGDGLISNAIVENNVIYNNCTGAWSSAINLDGVANSIIRNNLMFDNPCQGISNFRIDGSSASSNNQILNNTLVMTDAASHALKFRNGSTGGYIRNNILIQQGSGDALAVSSDSMSGLDSDYNIIIHTTSASSAVEDYSGLSNWQSSTGQDAHSFSVSGSGTSDILNKIFVNPTTNINTADYSLKSTSAAVDAGATVANASKDINDYNRPLGSAYDIGAFEYGGSNIMPTPQNVEINEN